MGIRKFLIILLLLGLNLTSSGWATTDKVAGNQLPEDLSSLSISELKGIKLSKVTSVSRKEEKLFEAASSIFVITQKDIRRSGLLSIPELLRLVPGIEVAQIDGNKWAITSRGFNSRFASKMLILIDGRSVYTTTYSGVFWDQLDYPLEDIERIEVIKGPGGTLWGANAVNGVINIITKNAKDTEGGMVTAGAGNLENGFGTVRYGTKVNEDLSLRVYGKYFKRDELEEDGAIPALDNSQSGRGGFRADWTPSQKNTFSIQGEYFQGDSGNSVPSVLTSISPIQASTRNETEGFKGGHVLSRWNRTISQTSDMQLQLFYHREARTAQSYQPAFQVNTYDLDFQHRFQLADQHEMIWGMGSRFILDRIENNFNFSFFQSSRTNYLIGGFLQDTWTVVPDKFKLTIGTKLSVNSYTGFEFQPSGRALWTIDDKQTLWAAFSRAVRIPSRIEDGARINLGAQPGPGGLAVLTSVFGNKDVNSEELFAMEFGYRVKPSDRLYFDISAFYNLYENLNSFSMGATVMEATPAPTHLLIPFNTGAQISGETYGIEIAAKWNVLDYWKLEGGFNWLEMNINRQPGAIDLTSGTSPRFQWKLRSLVDLPHNLEWDTSIYYVDRLARLQTPQYTRMDMRLGWRPNSSVELSVGVLDILDGEHYEFGPVTELNRGSPTRIPRSGYGKITFKF